jgi:hypothetical protein
LPSRSPHSRPSSFPNPSAENFVTNLPSFLERSRKGSWLHRRATLWACGFGL